MIVIQAFTFDHRGTIAATFSIASVMHTKGVLATYLDKIVETHSYVL